MPPNLEIYGIYIVERNAMAYIIVIGFILVIVSIFGWRDHRRWKRASEGQKQMTIVEGERHGRL